QPLSFVANTDAPKRLLIGSARLDWQLNPSHMIAFRYDSNLERLSNQGVGGFNLPERGFGVRQLDQSFRVSETRVINSKMVNEARIGLSLNRFRQQANSNQPVVLVPGSFSAGGSTPNFLKRNELRLEIADNLIVSAGKHQLKLGAQIFYKN